MTQFRQGSDDSNASFVANSNPFEALKDYQPGTDSAQHELIAKPIAAVKDTFSRLPGVEEVASQATEFAMEAESVSTQFVNTAREAIKPFNAVEVETVEAEAIQSDSSSYDLGMVADGSNIFCRNRRNDGRSSRRRIRNGDRRRDEHFAIADGGTSTCTYCRTSNVSRCT